MGCDKYLSRIKSARLVMGCEVFVLWDQGWGLLLGCEWVCYMGQETRCGCVVAHVLRGSMCHVIFPFVFVGASLGRSALALLVVCLMSQ